MGGAARSPRFPCLPWLNEGYVCGVDSTNIFTDNWDEPPVLCDGERLYRIHTDDPSDNLFTVRPADGRYNRITDDEFREHVRSMLRAKYGKRGWYMLDYLEDVTGIYYE